MDEALTRLRMPVPDAALACRARERIADVAAPALVNHSVRVCAWANELARHDRLEIDPEILYVAAMLHDIGLVAHSCCPAIDHEGSVRNGWLTVTPRLTGTTGTKNGSPSLPGARSG